MTEFQSAPDAADRLRALDPTGSFIVQAPAGSGKTGLLIQRYLRLLTCVDNPEEIVAITFTRKAAAEMRERILSALKKANNTLARPENAFDRLTCELAIAAIQRDRKAGWHIVENPARLRIQTIDSLCASLTQQMPVLSKFGSQPETTENPEEYYLEAVRATVALLNQDHDIADDIEMLLTHLDNDMARIENLLVGMLARRDHWLRHIHRKTRDELEASLKNFRQNVVDHLCGLIPGEIQDELLALVRYAAANLSTLQQSSVMIAARDLIALPENVEQWCVIADLLLQANGEWRKKLDTRQGFPAGKTKMEKENAQAWKIRIINVINALKTNNVLQQALQDIRQLPLPVYSDNQWEILGAITRLLPYAVAQLKIIFQLTGQVDFIEVSQSALAALGDSEMPTDLALALDYRIKHLLIDEFQDTSISQYQLIEKLVVAWEFGDSRSLFAVGDPMQSIYRFREAEVGLFLQSRQTGIGGVKLHPITLRSNFRSQQGIVHWINNAFKQIMPAHEDIAVGAVPYTPSIAVHAEQSGQAVTVHPAFEKESFAEAAKVLTVILQSRQSNPTDSIAVLVRNRSHLSEIVTTLKLSGLRFHAVEIDALYHKPIVQDLLMLTRALSNPADRLAWLAVLRAPWCGLQLDDLQSLISVQTIVQDGQSTWKTETIWELISDENCWHSLSHDGIERLRRVSKVFVQCMQNRYRQLLRTTVEFAWKALGGPGCIDKSSISHLRGANATADALIVQDKSIRDSLNDAMIFFEYLEKHEKAGNILDFVKFEEKLAKLFASADFNADVQLQIMTIHKSKGLEFDTVLVPGLGYTSKTRGKQLLNWMEQPRRENTDNNELNSHDVSETDLFLAPIQKVGKENDSINIWMESLERKKENYEAERLLYVAATRAKKYLHLFGHTQINAKDGEPVLQQPRSGSLLKRLWPAVEHIYINAARMQPQELQHCQSEKAGDGYKKQYVDQSILRLTTAWQLPVAPKAVSWKRSHIITNLNHEIEFSWASEVAKHVGSIVHRWLQQIAEDKLKGWDAERVQSMRKKFAYGLLKNGLSADDKTLEQAVERIVIALTNSISDRRGRWILGEQYEAQNELRLTGVIDGNVVDYVIDRTFCDATNIRWIIDYKTSSHEGSGVESFLDREQERYRHQLNNYANFFRKIDTRAIRLGLFFPMLKGWRTWSD
ncbi:ATP-dependent exoDNAse (exonuclease V) beta subunit (contains helicase and exonuclease domains) [Nitrosomonas aestuarii]|uniref:DNA 3'-5' helicase n=1 Tax=Nitrosomonas aestuarii TaxID=52441 RepID=A0A1I4DXD3_9PROT|nr:UvrD-helicase domain-containing protein [Nitrosomonas aestuarii]SFK97350.1 ATP-dependent exoDNAse (exonuclease V) beta subunit (contains helicase and exonuclease domains) [Nitrosomonas aestuarii]